MKTENRYEMAEARRAPLAIKNQGTPSNVIRITRYQAGQVVEIIERTESQQRAVERKVLTASKTRAKSAPLAGERPEGCSKGCAGRICLDALHCDAPARKVRT